MQIHQQWGSGLLAAGCFFAHYWLGPLMSLPHWSRTSCASLDSWSSDSAENHGLSSSESVWSCLHQPGTKVPVTVVPWWSSDCRDSCSETSGSGDGQCSTLQYSISAERKPGLTDTVTQVVGVKLRSIRWPFPSLPLFTLPSIGTNEP